MANEEPDRDQQATGRADRMSLFSKEEKTGTKRLLRHVPKAASQEPIFRSTHGDGARCDPDSPPDHFEPSGISLRSFDGQRRGGASGRGAHLGGHSFPQLVQRRGAARNEDLELRAEQLLPAAGRRRRAIDADETNAAGLARRSSREVRLARNTLKELQKWRVEPLAYDDALLSSRYKA
jgi:hypothetical protein